MYLSSNYKLILFSLLVFSAHLFTINYFPTNFEGAYAELAFFFQNNNKMFLLDSFYNLQANTYFFSILASGLSFILSLEPPMMLRILSAASYFILIHAFIKLLDFANLKFKYIYLLVFLTNPLIWNYGYKIYVDLFSFSLGLYGFSIFINDYNSKNKQLISAVIITAAVLLKPFNLIFIFINLIFIFLHKKKINIYVVISFLTPIICFIVFIIINKIIFDFYVLPFKFISDESIFVPLNNINTLFFNKIISNFIYYLGFLGLIIFPISLGIVKKEMVNLKNCFIIFFITIFALLLSLYLSDNYGELSLGPLQKYFGVFIYKFIISFSFIYLVYFIFNLKNFYKNKIVFENLKNIYFFIFFVLIYIICLCFLKLSQRYLILVVPFIYIILLSLELKKFLLIFHIFINVILNFFLLFHYTAQSSVSEQLYSYMYSKNILFNTNPGIYLPHLMHKYQSIENFNKNNNYFLRTVKYEIILSDRNNNLECVYFSYKFLNKEYNKVCLKKL